MPLHPLLQRQLRKLGIQSDAPPSAEEWASFVERVSATYGEADQDRYMTERALQQSSKEIWQLYDELRASSAAEISRQREELAKSLALMTSVQESVNEAILVVDRSGVVLSVNNRWLEMWGLKREDVEGTSSAYVRSSAIDLVLNPDDVVARVQQLNNDPRSTAVDELKMVDGRIISRFTAPVRAANGEITARVWCYRDVTEERKLIQRRAVVAERMASVGQLVSSVAHEVNNPLAYIAGNVDVVMDALRSGESDPEEMLEALEDARTGVDRIKVIVRDLSALSRVDEEHRSPTDVRVVLESALQMANNELRHRAKIIRDLGPVPLVSANAVRLGQVFLNLLMNAAHAIPDGRASENSVSITTSVSPLGYARIEIRDTGSGIESGILERIYDPFFTTKPLGTGTGLGLSICKGIIDKLDGTIEVVTEVGVGTMIAVEIPPASIESMMAAQNSDRTSAPPSGERHAILVVDDDAQIRRWFTRVLSQHEVTAVPSVEAAEEILEQRSFDVVLCDVMMPDRTALDMFQLIEKKRPELLPQLIFMSGGAFTPALAKFLETVPNTCLKKPFRKHEVEKAIALVARQTRLVAQDAVHTDSSRSFTLT